MRWLSKSVDDLIANKLVGEDGKPAVHDAIVIGSGYGGAVSALRLAEAGINVLVLERGEEWSSREFPNDIGNAMGAMRLERSSSAKIDGYESGLYDLHTGENFGALVGNGLGGTSLINANVVIEPDLRVFDKKRESPHGTPNESAWPAGLQRVQGSLNPKLDAAYKKAMKNLGAERFENNYVFPPSDKNGVSYAKSVEPQKLTRLKEMEKILKSSVEKNVNVEFVPNWLTVSLGTPDDGEAPVRLLNTCIGCGNCVSGCNENAKKSLDTTYLAQAYVAGAQMFTGASVLSVRQSNSRDDGADGHWVIEFVATHSRSQLRETIPVPTNTLHAKHVILSAGTFGSTEILLRSKARGLALSDTLGQRLSTNGDSLAFGYMLDKPVHGIGMGSKHLPGTFYGVGPTITGSIRVRHDVDVEKNVLIQEGSIPGAIVGLFHEMVTTSAAFAQLDECKFRNTPAAAASDADRTDWAVLDHRALKHTQTLLAMGHDQSQGRIEFDPAKDRIKPVYDVKTKEATYLLQDKYLSQVAMQGAIYIQNPVLDPLPARLSSILDSPQMGNSVFTVHPLGGCCMADNAAQGVVDEFGRVFNPSPAPNSSSTVWQGLYVLDGSIVPTSLGANPLLTIAALAERAMSELVPHIAAGKCQKASIAIPPNPMDRSTADAAYTPNSLEVKVHFTEVMRGKLTLQGEQYESHLLLHLPINDLQVFWSDGAHQLVIPNQQDAEPGDREKLEPRLRLDRMVKGVKTTRLLKLQSGRVSILPVPLPRSWTRVSQWIRTIFTWFIERGRDEICIFIKSFFGMGEKPAKPGPGFKARIVGFLKLAKHASECRVMEYRLSFVEEAAFGKQPFATYQLLGTKQVGYPASWGAIGQKVFSGDKYLQRTNVWQAFGRLDVKMDDGSGPLPAGTLDLDLLDMTKMHAPQLGLQRDTPNALLALAGYPLWFLRLIVKTRLWDFRLPDYPKKIPKELHKEKTDLPLPASDIDNYPTHWPHFPCLKVFEKDGVSIKKIPAQTSMDLPVRASAISLDKDKKTVLKLTRYKQDSVAVKKSPDERSVQVKALLMLNGFAQSTLGFVPQEHMRRTAAQTSSILADEPGLAEFFYQQGFDIWLFDYRTSSILEASKQPSTMDDIAAIDIPEAVNHVMDVLQQELTSTAQINDGQLLQIYAFGHCVGSASLVMSLLGGHLQHKKSNPKDANELSIGKLAGVTFSQMQAFSIGGETAQERIQTGGIVRDALGVEYVRLSAAERTATAAESLMDRLFASLPVTDDERCPNENARSIERPDICTCKRMTGWISRLLKHDRIKPETHALLPVYFGRANTSTLVHCGRCLENERLVNADGQNIYVTDDNISQYLRLPVALLHGAHNVVLDVESAHRTFDQICRVNSDLGPKSETDLTSHYQKIIARSYAHFDCTIGFGPCMQKQILQPLKAFYDNAWEVGARLPKRDDKTPNISERSIAKAPLAGPIIGWSRLAKNAENQDIRLLRLWIEVDETESDAAAYAVTVLRHGTRFVNAQLWPVEHIVLQDMPIQNAGNLVLQKTKARVAIAMADLELPVGQDATAYTVTMLSVHEFLYRSDQPQVPQPSPGIPVNPNRAARSPGEGVTVAPPITPEELKNAGKRPGQLPGVGQIPLIHISRSSKEHLLWRLGPESEWTNRFKEDMALWQGLAEAKQSFDNHYVERINPIGIASFEEADLYTSTLSEKDDLTAGEALCGKPANPSRKSRHLPAPTEGFRYTAQISPALLAPPSESKGVRFLAACCRHPGLAFEDRRSDASFDHIRELLGSDRQRHRDFMLMLGDQIYADATAGLLDSPSPIEKIALRSRHAFNTRGFNSVTSELPTYMVIDDHEIGDNWSLDNRLPADRAKAAKARALYRAGYASHWAYQYAHSPRNVGAPGFNYQFAEAGIPFFVLDTRTRRRRFDIGTLKQPELCDGRQLARLHEWLTALSPNNARPKFIVSGSVLAPGLRFWDLPNGLGSPAAESWQMAPSQRIQVLQMIQTLKIKNVVFLSGDYHCDATAELCFEGGLKAFAIVTPPLYAALPFANTKVSDVLEWEEIQLGNPDNSSIVTVRAKAQSGSGFADIQITPQLSGKWEMAVHFHRLDLDHKTPRYRIEVRRFVLD